MDTSILTMKEAAKAIGVSRRSLGRLVQQGRIKPYFLSGKQRAFGVTASELARFNRSVGKRP